ncbi:hypothetical protein [Paractinoplanes rishiriensis]|uniref:DUF3592 domain-containing protein n=1 Tax=Paractinoplanes rishiriensis TaxID=1050105 RepID=A0A919N0Q2_9ACTN|nr:hypothetical protein [Actinoplanes rishiriensis]GIE95392.1 hypothetical protein Ari01nite_28570 [Actinoplanes rishiriensis]
MDLKVKALIPTLALLACLLAGSVLVDMVRDVVYRTTWSPAVAIVDDVYENEAGRQYRLSYLWKGEARGAWTERDAGDPQLGDRVDILIDDDDPGNVAMRGWAWDNRFSYLARFGAAALVAAGAFLVARHLWRKSEPSRAILRPRGNPGPRHPRARKKNRRRG